MTIDEALNLLEKILETRQLSKIQRIVFCQAWEGQSYLDIANTFDYDYSYIKDTGSQLWQMLSTALGQKVTKFNFQSVLKHYAKHREFKALWSPNYATTRNEDETRWVGR